MAPGIALTLMCLLGAAPSGDADVRGGGGPVRVSGEGMAYHLLTPSKALTIVMQGPGELNLKLRGILPAGTVPSEGARVRVTLDGKEVTHVPLSLFQSGTLEGRSDRVPGGASTRTVDVPDGEHKVVVETARADAAALVGWKGKRGSKHAVVAVVAAKRHTSPRNRASEPPEPPPAALTEEPAPPSVPLAPPPLVTAPPQPAPLPAAPLLTAPPQPPPSAFETTEVAAPAPPSQSSRSSALPLALLGGAVVCAAGSGVTLGLAVSSNSSYNSTVGASASARAGQLSTANTEAGVAEGLGIAAVALLVGAGIALLVQ